MVGINNANHKEMFILISSSLPSPAGEGITSEFIGII